MQSGVEQSDMQAIKRFIGEADLRAEPSASGALWSSEENAMQSGVERSDRIIRYFRNAFA